MMQYRRKINAGTMVVCEPGKRIRKSKSKITHFNPGDTIEVESEKNLPGYPNQIDGWEFVGNIPDKVMEVQDQEAQTQKRTRSPRLQSGAVSPGE